jgi:hypothetical protein
MNEKQSYQNTKPEKYSEELMSPPSSPSPKKGFRKYLAEKKNEFIAGAIGFAITVVIIGTFLAIGQEWLKKKWFSDEIALELKLINAATALFPDSNSFEIVQLLTYDLSASDLVKKIKVTAIFSQLTEVVRYNVVYSVDVSGFKPDLTQKNYLILILAHDLDITKKATIYILTKRKIPSRQDTKVELPNIHVEGEDKNGKTVYF